jgi:hypothetical protein
MPKKKVFHASYQILHESLYNSFYSNEIQNNWKFETHITKYIKLWMHDVKQRCLKLTPRKEYENKIKIWKPTCFWRVLWFSTGDFAGKLNPEQRQGKSQTPNIVPSWKKREEVWGLGWLLLIWGFHSSKTNVIKELGWEPSLSLWTTLSERILTLSNITKGSPEMWG